MTEQEAAGRFDEQLPPDEPRQVSVPRPDAGKLLAGSGERAGDTTQSARSLTADPPNGGGGS